jgi:hypothetical protein
MISQDTRSPLVFAPTAEQIDVRLIDQPGANNNRDFVLTDTVRLIEQLRSEGRNVFLHCVAAQSRTPTVAALHGARWHATLFDSLKNAGTPVIVENVVNRIDEVVKAVRFEGWQATIRGDQEVRQALRKTLYVQFKIRDNDVYEKAPRYVREYY